MFRSAVIAWCIFFIFPRHCWIRNCKYVDRLFKTNSPRSSTSSVSCIWFLLQRITFFKLVVVYAEVEPSCILWQFWLYSDSIYFHADCSSYFSPNIRTRSSRVGACPFVLAWHILLSPSNQALNWEYVQSRWKCWWWSWWIWSGGSRTYYIHRWMW